MEFCGDQCTLDRISRETSGLPEKIVRNYTKSLLKAVDTLHEHGGQCISMDNLVYILNNSKIYILFKT